MTSSTFSMADFEKQFPLLAMACHVVDYEGEPNRTMLADLIGTSICKDFPQAEFELQLLTALDFHAVIYGDPTVDLPLAPTACRVLSSIFD